MEYDEFVLLVAQRADVPEQQAAALTRATMMTLAERITAGQATDLAEYLPAELAPPLMPPVDLGQSFDTDEFVRRVCGRADTDETVARRGVAAVCMTLREAVPADEFQDTLDQLPSGFPAL
ncbi:DUF2267 domain-containing protein [Streptomyces poonensis]|uniref:DUF2267 domain-containing protein n=1 Tax=Streptomyces poonensis TaxID=68255 RepID=A0A918PC36_9ACTN|nr:DUF2267 domain-containing protein [Streptomyces poonensis]GGY98849.1 hypothetical protein GCM10010365_16910 [Streptomyces poonensis]